MQQTIASSAYCEGIGLHSGQLIEMTVKPAPVNAGISFMRKDVSDPEAAQIFATWDRVSDTMMCTKISNRFGVYVATIEHLMAALYACEIDNAIIEISASEVPVMDGSSEPFIKLFEEVGVKVQNAPRKYIEVLKTVRIGDDNRWAEISPSGSFDISCNFSFGNRADFEDQSFSFDGTPEAFKKEIMRARTFGFLQDVERLWESGLAKGGSLDNAVVLDGNRIVNHEGLRYENECVRHKILDAVGDLYTAGYRIRGSFKGSQIGHEIQNSLLHALFRDESAWRLVEESDGIPTVVFG